MNQNAITLLGIPVEYGARQRGCTMGPTAMRSAGLPEALEDLGYEVIDQGDVAPRALKHPVCAIPGVKNLDQASAWTQAIIETADKVAETEAFPLFLGGDHSMSLGTVVGINNHANRADRPLFVLWLDAHTDFNTFDSSPSGNIHGMPVSFFCGAPGFEPILGEALPNPINPKNVYMMGIRSVDQSERNLVRRYGITVHDMRSIDELGVVAPLRRFLDKVAHANGMLHVSLDVDFLDPETAPGVGTRVPGGVTFREAHLIMEMLFESRLVTSMDLAELNPLLDIEGRTANFAIELISSMFGKRVV